MLADSHTHLLERYYGSEVGATLDRAREAGVGLVVNVATTAEDSRETIALAEREPDVVATAGVHPHEARTLDRTALEALKELTRHTRVVAVGECGLDYHYDLSPRDVQREALRQQIRLARSLGKPLVLHNRESDDDLLAILEQEGAQEVGGVLHCFAADPEMALRVLALGFHLGFAGMLTFKQATNVRESFAQCPDDRLLLETDSPYLTPAPLRGQRNEPARVRLVLEKAAELRGRSAEEMAEITGTNLKRLFRLA